MAYHDVKFSQWLPVDWRGRRGWRCFSTQDGQRVCPGTAGCRQSLQRPDFFILRRCSAARARRRSCRSSGVRRTRFGFSEAFGFAVRAVSGFEALRARVCAAFGLAGFLVLRLGSCLGSQKRIGGHREIEFPLETLCLLPTCAGAPAQANPPDVEFRGLFERLGGRRMTHTHRRHQDHAVIWEVWRRPTPHPTQPMP